jgi:hypothetical protein
MARTINEILAEGNAAQNELNSLFTQITNSVNADANLSGLTSPSKTAEFNLWKYVWAAMSYIQEAIWGEAQSEIQAIADAAIPGTDKWLQKEILKFQYGDALLFDTVTAKYYYATITPANQIIARCAVVSAGGLTTIKVAKISGGLPVVLSTLELNALKSYVQQIQWSGSNLTVISYDSDLIDARFTIYYNGVIPLATIQASVQAAYDNYLANLPFNGQYNITRHIDALQAADSLNINDVVQGTVQAKTNAGSYAPLTRIYNPLSGYIKRDPAVPFSTLLTYVAQ